MGRDTTGKRQGLQAASLTLPLPISRGHVLGGEGVIQNSSGRSRAGHFPPRTAGGSIAYVFTPKQQVATFSQL